MNFRRKSVYKLSFVMQQCNLDAMLTNEKEISLTDIYRVGYRANCVDYNAQCDNLSDNYCVCQCYPGYVIGYRNCVKGYILISSFNYFSH